MVKSWRYFESAIRFLLPERKRLDLKERSRYLTVDPDFDAEEREKKELKMLVKRSASVRRQNYSDGFFSSEEFSQNPGLSQLQESIESKSENRSASRVRQEPGDSRSQNDERDIQEAITN